MSRDFFILFYTSVVVFIVKSKKGIKGKNEVWLSCICIWSKYAAAGGSDLTPWVLFWKECLSAADRSKIS